MLVKRAIEHHCLNLPKRAEDGFSQDHISDLQDIFTDKKRFGFAASNAFQIKKMEELKIEEKTRALTDDEMEWFCKTKELCSTKMTAPKMEYLKEKENFMPEELMDLSRDMWEERKETE